MLQDQTILYPDSLIQIPFYYDTITCYQPTCWPVWTHGFAESLQSSVARVAACLKHDASHSGSAGIYKNEWSWRCERLKTRCLCPVFSGVCVRKDEQTTTLCCFYVWHSVTTFIELQLYYKLHVWCSDVWWICCSKQPFWIVSLSDR